MHFRDLPCRIQRKRNRNGRAPAWAVQWEKSVVFDDGQERASLHFVDSTFGEAYPTHESPNPEADTEAHAKWSCSLSAFNYVAELFNRVLKKGVDVVDNAGLGPLQTVEDHKNDQGHVVGNTYYHDDSERHQFKVWSHWIETNAFGIKELRIETDTFLPATEFCTTCVEAGYHGNEVHNMALWRTLQVRGRWREPGPV